MRYSAAQWSLIAKTLQIFVHLLEVRRVVCPEVGSEMQMGITSTHPMAHELLIPAKLPGEIVIEPDELERFGVGESRVEA